MSSAEGEKWKQLAEALQKLCIAYRIGSQPSNKTLDTIEKLTTELQAR